MKALPMHIIMNIFIKETEARKLWERCAEQEGEPPIGQDLADWIEGLCTATIENNFMYDAHVDPRVDAQCQSTTEALLKELLSLDKVIEGHGEEVTPPVTAAKERREDIKAELVDEDDPEASEKQLNELLHAYAAVIGYTHPEGPTEAVQ